MKPLKLVVRNPDYQVMQMMIANRSGDPARQRWQIQNVLPFSAADSKSQVALSSSTRARTGAARKR